MSHFFADDLEQFVDFLRVGLRWKISQFKVVGVIPKTTVLNFEVVDRLFDEKEELIDINGPTSRSEATSLEAATGDVDVSGPVLADFDELDPI